MIEFFKVILSAEFLQNLLLLFFQLCIALAEIILLPINILVTAFIPDLSLALSRIPPMLDLAGTYIGWLISSLGVPSIIITLTVFYYIFILSTRATFWAFKLALKWLKALPFA